MKKDIKWLKNKLEVLKEVDKDNWKQCEPNSGNQRHFDGSLSAIEKALDFIDELDDSEVLSQEWIDEHRVARINNLRKMTTDDVVPADKLQNLLVPKQEELETKIHELIEAYKQEEDAYSNPENGWISGFIEDLKNLVEEEQKYYVDLDSAAYVAKWNGDDQVDIYTDDIAGSDEFEFHLTEQEIKNYDERFWPFAEPVE